MVCNYVIKNLNLRFLGQSFNTNVNKLILKDLGKFQVDTPKNAKVMAVQNFENLDTFILWQPCWWTREPP